MPAPGVKMNGPLLPPLSRHVPLTDGSVTAASTCTGAPPGVVTCVNPSSIVPFGLSAAVKVRAAVDLPEPTSPVSRPAPW